MPTGLTRRESGRYAVRRRIPADLVEHYRKKELVRALGTADPIVARRLLPLAWIKLDEEFTDKRDRTHAASLPETCSTLPDSTSLLGGVDQTFIQVIVAVAIGVGKADVAAFVADSNLTYTMSHCL